MPASSITDRRLVIQPGDVHQVLSRHMLADGYEIVMDLAKSKGSWVFDAKRSPEWSTSWRTASGRVVSFSLPNS